MLLSKSLLEPLFQSDEQIQNLIKETLHELNTPVSTIQINNQMIKRKEENPKNIQRCERIEQACQNLLNLYTQMEYSIKKEVSSIELEEINIKEIVEKYILNFDDIKQDIEIINDIKIDFFINTDKNGFEKVINNLIANAIKYNKPNGYVRLKLEEKTLSIQNSGEAIDTGNLSKIFDKYYQQDNSNSGIGLGLNMVKEFCDKNKIKINIESNINSGTTIYLTFNKK